MPNIIETQGWADGQYLYFPSLNNVAILECRNELVGMTSNIVICAACGVKKRNLQVNACLMDSERRPSIMQIYTLTCQRLRGSP